MNKGTTQRPTDDLGIKGQLLYIDSQMLGDTKPLKYLLVKVRGSQLARLAEADFLAIGRINLPTTNMHFTSSKTAQKSIRERIEFDHV